MKIKCAHVWPFVVSAMLALSGCQSPAPSSVSGVATERAHAGLRVGDTMPDVSFVDQHGKTHELSAVCRDACLIIVHSHASCKVHPQVLAAAQNPPDGVTIVEIASAASGCKKFAQCVLRRGDKARHIISICDEGGKVRRLLGITAPEAVFLVDRRGKIRAKGTLADLKALRRQADRMAAQAEAEREALYSG